MMLCVCKPIMLRFSLMEKRTFIADDEPRTVQKGCKYKLLTEDVFIISCL